MYIDQVAVGMEIEVPGRLGAAPERGVVIEIVDTARRCEAVVHVPNPDDHRGYTPRAVPLIRRTPTQYRCKFAPASSLPLCPLAYELCESPCDALSIYGRSDHDYQWLINGGIVGAPLG